MNLPEAMRIYVQVADLASFTRAADSLGLPKTSVSAAVQQLENRLGTRLLHRTTRRVEMTQDGRLFRERCLDLLADMDELDSLFRESPQTLRGRLRVDLPTGMARNVVIPALPAFLAAHPDLSEAVQQQISLPRRRLIAGILQRGVDAGQLRADLDVELAIDMLYGLLYARKNRTPPLEPAEIERYVDLVLGGLR